MRADDISLGMRQGSDESRDSILDFIKGVTVQTPHITFRRHGCAIMYTNIIEDKLQVFSTPSEGFVKKKKNHLLPPATDTILSL